MQHVWQFYVELKDEEKKPIHLNYVTQTARKGKVVKKIVKDLIDKMEIKEEDIKDFYIRKIR